MKIVIAGGGAAGMLAALAAKTNDNDVCLIEKNEKLGKKIYITGKGRCNLTNACFPDEFFDNIVTNKKFMYSSFYDFTNYDTIDFFEKIGLKTKIERGNRVFPESDHSSDVIRVLNDELRKQGVEIKLNTKLKRVVCEDGAVSGIETDSGFIAADKVILALGGKSYPSCGADGDTWIIPALNDVDLVQPFPSLVPLVTKEEYVKELQGLSLKNVSVWLEYNDRRIYEGFGEMLFTHFGVSGPLVLSASCFIKESMYKENIKMFIDLKPALSIDKLDERILRDFSENQNKQLCNGISKLLPSTLIPICIKLSEINPRKKINEISREERERLVNVIKKFPLTIVGNRGFNEAIITKGGVKVSEINPSTMECKKIKGLFFAGEMIDVDAFTGGFNLQIAWSTGHLAGISAGNSR